METRYSYLRKSVRMEIRNQAMDAQINAELSRAGHVSGYLVSVRQRVEMKLLLGLKNVTARIHVLVTVK